MSDTLETSKKPARNWVFTLNNYTDEDLERIAKPYEQVKYIAYSKEVGESGTPHLQGFVCMWDPCRLSFFKRQLPRAHMEIMMGRLQDSDVYCSKQSELIEIGQRPDQGRRTDLIGVKRRIDRGELYEDLIFEEPVFNCVARHDRFFTKYAAIKRRKEKQLDRDVPDVIVRIGPSGTGKSRWLDDRFGLANFFTIAENNGKWFDNCDRDIIMFDDVDVNSIPPLSLFKRLTDRYPMQVPVKGGYITWKPKTLIFTANSHPFTWWPDLTDFDKAAIERRITEIVVVE